MKRIVLIDDDNDDAELFSEALEAVNLELQFQHFESAWDALATLEMLQIDLPNFIFLDINLPIMSGWEFITRLKKNHYLTGIPVFMYTTSSQKREKDMANDLGAAGFITKPNDFNDLIKLLNDILELKTH